MRTFYLRFVGDTSQATPVGNFVTYSAGAWTTEPIDLYDNIQYKNYSTIKSDYGTNTLGNNVWTGLTPQPATPGGRFIDTTGRIDLVSFNLEVSKNPGDGEIAAELDVYVADRQTLAFPDEWVQVTDLTTSTGIGVIDSPRYVKFVLKFESHDEVSLTSHAAVLWVRVQIDTPVMVPLYEQTRVMLDNFPHWMEMREVENTPATPELATPVSVGGSVLNALSGEWLDDLHKQLRYVEFQLYIETVDLSQAAWVYRADQVPQFVNTIVGNGLEVGRAASLEELYEALPEEHVSFWDEETDTLYTNRKYASFQINGIAYAQSPHHVWNWLDELGLQVDLGRLLLESNESYRHRILDVHVNKPGVGIEQFKLALRRELNLWQYATPTLGALQWVSGGSATPYVGATPYSTAVGATPEVLEMVDVELDAKYVDPDGMPTERFRLLADYLSHRYPTTWGRFRFDKSLWDLGGKNHEGYTVLPFRLDATPLQVGDIQAGVGDGNDLFVFHPDVLLGAQDFTARLRIRGKQKTPVVEYRPIEVQFEVQGQAQQRIYANPTINPNFTLELTTAASPAVMLYHTFSMPTTSNVSIYQATPTPSSYSTHRIFGDNSYTLPGHWWKNMTDGSDSTNQSIHANSINKLELKNGIYTPGSGYSATEVADTYRAWYSHSVTPYLAYNNAGPVFITEGASPNFMPRPAVLCESHATVSSIGTWYSETVPATLNINQAPPITSPDSIVYTFPNIGFPATPFLEAVPNKQYKINLLSNNGAATPTYGGRFSKEDASSVFLAASPYIAVDASTAWTGGRSKLFPVASTSVTFSSGTAGLYPYNTNHWALFEQAATGSYKGLVDENGPYRIGQIPAPGNTNYAWRTADVSRSDFNIPQTTSYVLTWMGLDILDNSQVTAWLDSNTINPAVSDGGATPNIFLDTAITEELEGATYSFTPFTLRARLQSNPRPEWYPQIHSGFFYSGLEEYYFFAKPKTETVTTINSVLSKVARLGAPIFAYTSEATPKPFRQVTFFNDSATPTALGISTKQKVKGSGTAILYLAYPNLYGVSVVDITKGDGVNIALASTASTNMVTCTTTTNRTHIYEATYALARSFVANNEYEETDGTQRTKLIFDSSTPYSNINVTYESSAFNPATPVSVPLSPLFTVIDEGFLFIDYNEYTLDQVQVYLSPPKVIADGIDYILISLRSLDANGNPKTNQAFTLGTTFGTLSPSSITTDRDGFAVSLLTSAASTTTTSGTITITGVVNTTVLFEIDPGEARPYRLLAAPTAERIPADGTKTQMVVGRVEDPSFNPVTSPGVQWKRARSMYELFTSPESSGSVTGSPDGSFQIGPFTSATPNSPGFWFLSAEFSTGGATPITVGDVVFWYEYPPAVYGVERMTGLIRGGIQMSTPTGAYPPYSSKVAYPVYYDEDALSPPATPITSWTWKPPKWFAMDRYEQYQLGFLGTTANTLSYSSIGLLHPSKREL